MDIAGLDIKNAPEVGTYYLRVVNRATEVISVDLGGGDVVFDESTMPLAPGQAASFVGLKFPTG